MQSISQNDFPSFVASNPRVVLKFTAPWCGPCRSLTPMLNSMVGDFPDIVFAEVNVDENPGLAAQFNVRGVPTMIGFVDATPKFVKVGLPPQSALREVLSSL